MAPRWCSRATAVITTALRTPWCRRCWRSLDTFFPPRFNVRTVLLAPARSELAPAHGGRAGAGTYALARERNGALARGQNGQPRNPRTCRRRAGASPPRASAARRSSLVAPARPRETPPRASAGKSRWRGDFRASAATSRSDADGFSWRTCSRAAAPVVALARAQQSGSRAGACLVALARLTRAGARFTLTYSRWRALPRAGATPPRARGLIVTTSAAGLRYSSRAFHSFDEGSCA